MEKEIRSSLSEADLPSRHWPSEEVDVRVDLPPAYRRPWTEEYIRDVLLNPQMSFDQLAKRHGRTPASVNRVRGMIREVVYDKPYEATDKRRELINRVLETFNYKGWDEETKTRYAVRGRGKRTDNTQKALKSTKAII